MAFFCFPLPFSRWADIRTIFSSKICAETFVQRNLSPLFSSHWVRRSAAPGVHIPSARACPPHRLPYLFSCFQTANTLSHIEAEGKKQRPVIFSASHFHTGTDAFPPRPFPQVSPFFAVFRMKKITFLPAPCPQKKRLFANSRRSFPYFYLWLPKKNSATVPGPEWLPITGPIYVVRTSFTGNSARTSRATSSASSAQSP